MSEQTGTATKPSWKQRGKRILLILASAVALVALTQVGIIRLPLPAALSTNADSRVAELEEELESVRGAAEEAASQHTEEVKGLRTELRDANTELDRLRPIVAKYETEFDTASGERLVADLREANGNLGELTGRYATHVIELTDVNRSLGAAASAAEDLDLAREFLEHRENFLAQKKLVDDALANLSPHLSPIQEVADGKIRSSGEARTRMEAASAELRRARVAVEQGTSSLDALLQVTQGLTARANTLQTAWQTQNPGETLSGPTAEEYVAGFDRSDVGQRLAARQVIWQRRLEQYVERGGLVQLPPGTDVAKLVRTAAFVNYIENFERTYAETPARRKYLGHMADEQWSASATDVRYLQDPGWKSKGVQWAENSIGVMTATFDGGDWKYLLGNSSVCRFPADANFPAELSYFSENFLAMVVADVGPAGEPALAFEK